MDVVPERVSTSVVQRQMTRIASILLVGAVVVHVACATSLGAGGGGAKRGTDVDGAQACLILAEVQEAQQRPDRETSRARMAAVAPGDRAAALGAMMLLGDEGEILQALVDDSKRHKQSVVGPLGECFLLRATRKSDRAIAACDRAARLFDRDSLGLAVVDAARGRQLLETRAAPRGRALIAQARQRAPDCAAVLMVSARASGDVEQALEGWRAAERAFPGCSLCAAEQARLIADSQGRTAAVEHWERALKLGPGHPDILRRLAAAVAGVDDARALVAYESAIESGAADYVTLMAAAHLASAASSSPEDPRLQRAVAFARRAADQASTDVEARRLIIELAVRRKDDAQALQAAQELLAIVPDDLLAHIALARLSRGQGKLTDAVIHYDAAARILANGAPSVVDEATASAVRAEHAGLVGDLAIDAKGFSGKPDAVIRGVQRAVRKVFVARLKENASMTGTVVIRVQTNSTGAVDEVVIENDGLGDSAVVASIVGNLRRANFLGGARRYSFDLEFR